MQPRQPNPFKPTAGANPPLLVGRDDVLTELSDGLDDGPGAPGRLTLITGQRGAGKTVMLNAAEQLAAERQWAIVSETATRGLVARLTLAAGRIAEDLGRGPDRGRRLTGVSVAGLGSVSLAERPGDSPDLRAALERATSAAAERGTGLLITLDEIQGADRTEMRELATTIQHLLRTDAEIALVMAGLPAASNDLLNDEVLTFLRRADRVVLGDVPLADVRRALSATFADAGRQIEPAALDQAAGATGGYPFLIQLVGYHLWSRSRGAHTLTLAHAAEGIEVARRKLGSTVHAAALAPLSDVDRTYLLAMARDDGPSRTAHVARRMQVSASYASVYRERLIAAQMIEPAGHGRVQFALPYLRDYLREHVAHTELAARLAAEE